MHWFLLKWNDHGVQPRPLLTFPTLLAVEKAEPDFVRVTTVTPFMETLTSLVGLKVMGVEFFCAVYITRILV